MKERRAKSRFSDEADIDAVVGILALCVGLPMVVFLMLGWLL